MGTRRRLRKRRQRRQRSQLTLKIVALIVLSIAVGATTAAFTATNTVAVSRATNKAHTISVAELTPANCSGANVGNITFYRIVGPGTTNIRYETGHQNDTNQIWLGTGARDNMNGGGGNDCMVPGGNSTLNRNETVAGGANTDYCYSGPGPGRYTINTNCEHSGSTGPYTTVTSVTGGF
jgi:hypothetical protein